MHSAFSRTCAALAFLFFAAIFLAAQAPTEKLPQNNPAIEERVWLAVEE
jgi:hypothetical protein